MNTLDLFPDITSSARTAPALQPIVALSLTQPWAWLIVRPDLTGVARELARASGEMKDIENRCWSTRFRGPTLIHAAKSVTKADYRDTCEFAKRLFPWIVIPPLEQIPRGGLVGRMVITGCVSDSPSRWFFGPYGFTFNDVDALPFQPLRGALGFFKVAA